MISQTQTAILSRRSLKCQFGEGLLALAYGHDQGDGNRHQKDGTFERANYLGTRLDNKLTFEYNANHIVKKMPSEIILHVQIEIFCCESYESAYVLL